MSAGEGPRQEPRILWPRPFLQAIPGLVLLAVLLAYVVGDQSPRGLVPYSALLDQVERGAVTAIAIDQAGGTITGVRTDGTSFQAHGPAHGIPDHDLEVIDAHGVHRDYEPPGSEVSGRVIFSLLSLIALMHVVSWRLRGPRQDMMLSGARRSSPS